MTAKASNKETTRIAWQTATSQEVDDGLCYLGGFYETNSRHDKGHLSFRGCMDNSRNQSGGCFCVSHLLELKGRQCDQEMRIVGEPECEYAYICEKISEWFRAAAELEVRSSRAKKLGTKKFKERKKINLTEGPY